MASADAIPRRYIGSNDNESIYNITIEVLDGLLGDSDVTQQKLQQVEFNDAKFQLLSLEGIDFIGVADPKLREDITTISVQDNQLTTLVDLVAPLTNKPLFPRLEHIFAPHNFIQFICSEPRRMLQNGWPAMMTHLVELDLAHNYLDAIPDIKHMPKIRRLRLANNRIRPPWKQLKFAKELEEIDLSNNRLDWTEAEFMLEVKVLRELRFLRNLKIAGNPFCAVIPDYILYSLKELATAQEKFLGPGSKSKYFMKEIDGIECNEALYDRAMAIMHPDSKRREFLAQVGLRGNNHLIDLDKEEEFLDYVVGGSTSYGANNTGGAGDGSSQDADNNTHPANQASLYRLILLAELCMTDPAAVSPAISMMLKYAKLLRDRVPTGAPTYLFDNLIPPTEQVTVDSRAPYEELAANRFTQTVFLLTQRVPDMISSLACVLGYLAGIPEGHGIIGKRAMATLTHMSTGGATFEAAVLDAVEKCVITQVRMFDKASRPVQVREGKLSVTGSAVGQFSLVFVVPTKPK
jgi:hypothetical protein